MSGGIRYTVKDDRKSAKGGRFLKRGNERIMFGECHAHLIMDALNYKKAVQIHKNGVNEQSVRDKLEIYRKFGITFVRDGGDALGVSERAAKIAPEYGIDYRTPVFAIHKNGHYGGIVGLGFDTMKEYHQLVLKAGERGADFIKIMISGIMDFAGNGGVTEEPLTHAEIREMIHIAHEEGFAVMAHANGARTVQDAVEQGVDSIEHGNFMDEESLQALAASHAVWVPTIVTISNLKGSGRFDDTVICRLERLQSENIHRAYELGAKIALGSDAGAWHVEHGQGLVDEYNLFVAILADKDKEDVEERLAETENLICKLFKKN